MKRALFISHEFSATGAPIVLLQIIEHMIEEKLFDKIDIISYRDGELREKFEALGNCYIVRSLDGLKIFKKPLLGIRFLFALPFILKYRWWPFFIPRFKCSYDLIFTNTVATGDFLPLFKTNKETRIISMFHELDSCIKRCKPTIFDNFKKHSHKIICVSQAVANNLAKYGFNQKDLLVIHPFIEKLVSPPREAMNRTFTVLGCGEISSRKGSDIFIETAFKLSQITDKKFKFIWVGKDSYGFLQEQLIQLRENGLEDKVTFTGFQSDVSPYFSNSDILFLSSREDPFPLVCLEAASIAKPCLYFPEAGGIDELLSNGAGIPIPFLDTTKAAEKLNYYIERTTELEAIGQKAFERWEHYCNKSFLLNEIVKVSVTC